MTPLRVRLAGFLSYKDEQEIAFEESSLWMLAGLNGSGKSSVFDAVTFALFGHHRGGARGSTDLINQDCDRLRVEFEFRLDGTEYLARRTATRNAAGDLRSTQQILQRVGSKWEPVPTTGQATGFKEWVRDHIGLDYETFTSSVLLLQGRAEKLLDSTHSGRAALLARIVDLGRYVKLHDRADARRKELRGLLEGIKTQLAGLPDVTDEQLLEAELNIQTAEGEHQRAALIVERLREQETQAKQWLDLKHRRDTATTRWQDATRLLSDAPAIERDAARLAEVRNVITPLESAHAQRHSILQSEARSKQLTAERERVKLDLETQTHAQQQASDKRTALQKRAAEAEKQRSAVTERLRELAGWLSKVELFERQQNALARLEADLARLPADPAGAAERAQALVDELTAIDRALPVLSRLDARRGEFRRAVSAATAAETALKKIQDDGTRLARERAESERQRTLAVEVRDRAVERATAARTLLQQARSAVEEFGQLKGKKVCRACGQELTPGHFAEEHARRREELAAAEAEFRAADAARKAAENDEAERARQLADLDRKLQDTRSEYKAAKVQLDAARAEADRCIRECADAYGELAEPFRSRVGPTLPDDWAAAGYPSASDLRTLRQRAAGLEPARTALTSAREAKDRWAAVSAQVAAARQETQRQRGELPSDPDVVRSQHVDAQARETAIAGEWKQLSEQLKTNESDLAKLTREIGALTKRLIELDAKLESEQRERDICKREFERVVKTLPESWRRQADSVGLELINRLKAERDQLLAADTDNRVERLNRARAEADSLKRALDELETEAANVPREARREPDVVRADLAAARRELDLRDAELRAVQTAREVLLGQREQRAKLSGQLVDAQRDYERLARLAQLLGRDYLQRHLVRKAERQIVDHANAVLDRLSGGQLFLRLVGRDDGASVDQALDLEAYNRTTGSAPINVSFLSGSQRFRVAVSLALGIGQYASRQHRPIESVIIDEGFGCLDRQGRQVMIQELQNLRGHLRCILLVSHQEEFADAFADGYRFELAGGATRVSRFQR